MKLKDLSIFKLGLGALIALAPLTDIRANSYIWEGTQNSFLTNPNNWSPAVVPVSTDITIFNNAGLGRTSPEIDATQSIGTISFMDSTAYTFSWTGPYLLTLDVGGVSNASTATSQTFNITNGGTLSFSNSASADVTASGKVHYNPNGGDLQFNGSATSSNAPINATNGGTVVFNTGTTADSSVITADSTSSITFNGTAKSESANITSTGNAADFFGITYTGTSEAGGRLIPTQLNLNGGNLQFLENSNPNTAVINASNGSQVVFDTGLYSTGTGPAITLNDTSILIVTQSNTVSTLNSNSPNATIALAANQDLTTNEPAGTHDIYAGNITGNVISNLNKSGDGDPTSILELTGTIDGAWGATVYNGTLIGNTLNLNRDITIDSPGILQFKQAVNGPNFTEVIVGNGTLTKEGPATLVIDSTSNNSGFAGNTQVNAGTLKLNGQLGGIINVFAILSGTGTANGTVNVLNGATIAPGNSIGTLFVGNYTQFLGGIYQVELNGSSSSATSLIHATSTGTTGTGTAVLNGGTVNISSTDGTFLINTPYKILTAEGGLTGTFTNATTTINPFLVPNLSYDPNNAYAILNTNFLGFAETNSELNVAAQIDSITNPNTDLQSVLHDLVGLTPAGLNYALDQLSGQQYTSIFQVSQLSTRRFLRDLMVPFRLNVLTDCEQPRSCCGEIEFWEDLQYGRTFVRGDHEAKGYRLHNIDFAIGAQMPLDECWNVGVAAFYEHDHIHYQLGGSARVNTILGAVYGGYQDEYFYALGDLLVGYSHFKLKRDIDFTASIDRTAHSRPKVYDVTFYTEGGINFFECNNYYLQPFVGLEFGWYRHNHFSENGANSIDLSVKSKDCFNFDSRLGLRISTILPWDLIFNAEAAWQYRCNQNDNKVRVRFENFGSEFSIKGPKQKRNGIDGTIFVAKNICGELNVFAQAVGERWEHFSNYTFAIGVDFKL
jgi:hypothetical protein